VVGCSDVSAVKGLQKERCDELASCVLKPKYIAQLPIAHIPGLLVVRIPKPMYLAHLPIAHVPAFTAAADLPKLAYR